MTAWWNDLSPRERLLLGFAGVLAAALLASLIIIRPLIGWNAQAEREAARARDAYDLTVAAAALAGTSSSAPEEATPLRQAVISTAGAAGVELVRIASNDPTRVEIQAAPADAEALFAWLGDLQTRYGAYVTFADVTRGDEGVATGQVLVFERRS